MNIPCAGLEFEGSEKKKPVYFEWAKKIWETEDTFKLPCRTFAYPYGDKNADIVRQVMEAGYDAAVTLVKSEGAALWRAAVVAPLVGRSRSNASRLTWPCTLGAPRCSRWSGRR